MEELCLIHEAAVLIMVMVSGLAYETAICYTTPFCNARTCRALVASPCFRLWRLMDLLKRLQSSERPCSATIMAVALVACARTPPPRVVVVTVDGLVPDSYLHPEAHGLRVPTLREIVAHGAYSEGARSVFPAVTYPAHTSMATGVVPARHGITLNKPFDPLDENRDGWRFYAQDIASPALWDKAERAGLRSALIRWPVTVGAHATWIVPEFWRGGIPSEETKLLRALSTPGLLEAVAASDRTFASAFAAPEVSDAAVTDIASYLLGTRDARLIMLHLADVDGAQHHHGLWSPEAVAAIENADEQLGRLEQAIDRSGLGPETTLIIASDHGFANVTRTVRPGALLRQAQLVQLDASGKVVDWKAVVQPNAGIAYVYLRDPNDAVTAQAVTRLFVEAHAASSSSIARVYDRDAIRLVGGDPLAFLAIEAQIGTSFAPGYGDYETAPTVLATHGYDPDRPEMRASLLLRGARVVPGPIADARLVDVAPTAAAILGLALGAVDGHAVGITAAP
jgi:predicted AlkP superfamily pyrophosphatase or phosphodiesterase